MTNTLDTLLLTGAAGTLGRVLRAPLADACRRLRLSDRLPCGDLAAHEDEQPCDLADRAAMQRLLRGVDAVVHFGGVAMESPFEQIAPANIDGVFHLYEAARLAGTRRIVFASSNHVTGAYPQGEPVGATSPPRPDGYYGVAKLFGENLAQLYWDRYGIESVCLRLGTVTATPPDRRALSTWLSFPDLVRLVLAALRAPAVGCLTVYGVSANPARWWSDTGWAELGYAPQDSAEAWRAAVQDLTPPADSAPARLQGGSFLALGPFDPLAVSSSPTAELWWQGPSELAESPLWSPADAAFFWVDISAHRLWRHDGAAAPARCWQLSQAVGCIALRAGGGLVAALRDGVYAVQLNDDGTAALQLIAAASHGPSSRFNDGRCDRQGRFWVSSLHDADTDRQPLGRIARLSEPGEQPQPWQPPLRDGLLVPNGLAFSPDGRRLYFSDSHASIARVWVCDYAPDTGQAGPPRAFIGALPAGRPDGAAVDAEGGYWICANDGGAVLRYTPDGRLDRRIAVPVAKPTMCAFGGADLSTLLITSMVGPQAQALAGALFAVRPGVAGLAETACGLPSLPSSAR